MNKLIIIVSTLISLNASAQYADKCQLEIICDYDDFYEIKTLEYNEPKFSGIPQRFSYWRHYNKVPVELGLVIFIVHTNNMFMSVQELIHCLIYIYKHVQCTKTHTILYKVHNTSLNISEVETKFFQFFCITKSISRYISP